MRVFYDQFGAAEWERFDRSLASRVSLEPACHASGGLDAGTHIMVALERPTTA